MVQLADQSEQLRYERKYLISDYTYSEVQQIIKFHPSCFKEIFHERTVNNIYFDTLGLENYYDNVEGSQNRVKLRIRWYDNLFGTIPKPILEYKIKKGLVGTKRSYKLNPFVLDQNFDAVQIQNALKNISIDTRVKNELLSMKPALLNSYNRKYYLSADKRYRVTIDHNLIFYQIRYSGSFFIAKSADHKSVILELKYDSSDETEAKQVASEFPFQITKNSKYLQGLERVYL